ncbi:hypothetical protein FZEAL_2145 [Fusarium zealandicum]|uniref:NAD-dependent epimerase/dehydratase domain-containing protein n=1 Tax=Fusarium zealandicum TaxID=1053134 RepID=A0A8H4XNQ1_9HYPO|nr:hypothetical protein FZEAL_2145 [Fusarium zealandicum]
MTNQLVLLTGATGFVGLPVLVTALQAGYRVRCAVRAAKGIDRILSTESIKKLGPLTRKISWVIVPDITAPGAYDEAVVDVEYIIHVASPVGDVRTHGDTSGTLTEDEIFVRPAVTGVVGMLESAAAHSPTLKRIVVTSSVVAILPTIYFKGEKPPEDKVFDADSRLENLDLGDNPGLGYFASKIAALNASEAWMKENTPKFDMISVMPAWVWGKNELTATAYDLEGGSNAILLSILKGVESNAPINTAGVSVHDVATAHVRALEPAIEGNQSFILGKHMHVEAANAIVKEHFPDAFTEGVFADTCRQATTRIPMDAEKTKTVLGLELESFESLIKEVAGQYLELRKKN